MKSHMRLLVIGFYLVGQGVNCDLAYSQTYDDEVEGALGEYESNTMYNNIPLAPMAPAIDIDDKEQRIYNHNLGIYNQDLNQNLRNQQDANIKLQQRMQNIQGRQARGYYDE